jgi:hypothetical protein
VGEAAAECRVQSADGHRHGVPRASRGPDDARRPEAAAARRRPPTPAGAEAATARRRACRARRCASPRWPRRARTSLPLRTSRGCWTGGTTRTRGLYEN